MADSPSPSRVGSLRGVAVSWLTFAGVLSALVGLNEWRSEFFNVDVARWTAGHFAWVLRLLGENGQASGVFVTSGICRFEIIGECTAFFPAAVLVAAILAYPASWKARLSGVFVGVPAIVALNLVRLVSLCYLNRWRPALFEMGHLLVWQSLLIFLTILLWLLWVAATAPPKAP